MAAPADRTRALRSALFGGRAGLRRVPLGDFPTPVVELPLPGIDASIQVKRDDLSSADYGGNKVRKLEFLLSNGRGPVVTVGAVGSHHVLACAIHARRLGRGCIGLLVDRPEDAHAAEVQGLLDLHLDGAVRLDRLRDLPRALRALARRTDLPRNATDMLWIPPGASNPAGTLGYVACGLELAAQVEAGECPAPARVYVALGTGGTAAGLALGLALAALPAEVVAVRVASRATGNRAFLEVLARRAFALLASRGLASGWPGLRLRVDHRFAGPGYGHATPEARRAVSAAAAAGLEIEITYTGKALAALVEDLRNPRAGRRGPAMFLHTCGSLAALRGAPAGTGAPTEERRCTTRC